MHKREATLILIFVGLTVPFSALVIGWWTTAALYLYGVFSFPERLIWGGARVGLAAGTLLVIVRWRRWVNEFYSYPTLLLVPVYIFWSLPATALLMGLPLALLAVGALAGVYIGRRAAHAGTDPMTLRRQAHRAALFTAAVTGLISLAMGLLALQDQHTLITLLRLFGFGSLGVSALGRAAVVVVAVPVLAVAQYVLARQGALWANRVGQ